MIRMTENHPIIPPPELYQQWCRCGNVTEGLNQAAQWGADQELEACCEFLYDNELCDPNFHKDLRDARRPKPLSLKEQALKALAEVDDGLPTFEWPQRFETIRRALEQLDD